MTTYMKLNLGHSARAYISQLGSTAFICGVSDNFESRLAYQGADRMLRQYVTRLRNENQRLRTKLKVSK